MAIRSIIAIALGSSMTVALATDAPQPENASATTAGCPGLTAQITLNDYLGTHLMQLCVAAQGLSITGGVANLHLYDNQADGIFHNGFEVVP